MLWIEAIKKLSFGLDDPFELEFVWRNLYHLSKLKWLNLQHKEINLENFVALKKIAEQLRKHIPPQYIVGWAEFFDLRFKVDERVLIPRVETEELVQLILEENDDEYLSVLDIGTGSGAIAISLAKNRQNWQVSASDISSGALVVAKKNSIELEVPVNIIQSDVFESIFGKFDIIVSNPPYISISDKDEVDLSVRTYEPKRALFSENQGLAIYERIASDAEKYLTIKGKMYFEIGYKQAEIVKTLFERAFPEKKVTVHQDIFEKDRMVSVTN